MQSLHQFRIMAIEASRRAIVASGEKLVQALSAYKRGPSLNAFSALQASLREYNNLLGVFNSDLVAARNDIAEYIDSKPASWADSDVARSYQRWAAELETAELRNLDVANRPSDLNLHKAWIISKPEHLEMPPVRLDDLASER
jgi:hypothetical protein